MEKEARLSTEMESLKNNTLLLNEMTANYIRSGASESELELMSVSIFTRSICVDMHFVS